MTTTGQLALAEFADSDSQPMVAAALHILGGLARDAAARQDILAPWAWSLRQRARALDAEGAADGARRARVIARLVSAVALGELSDVELSQAATAVDVRGPELDVAIEVLAAAMRRAV